MASLGDKGRRFSMLGGGASLYLVSTSLGFLASHS